MHAKRKFYRRLFVGIALFLMLASSTVLLLPEIDLPDDSTSHEGLSVSLIGFTNTVGGLPACSYSGTNATTGRFALLRFENLRGRSFRCDGVSLYLHTTDAPNADPELVRVLMPAPFEIAARGSATLTVPEPQTDARWHVAALLVPSKSWSRWPKQVRSALTRIGVDTRDKSYILGSKIHK